MRNDKLSEVLNAMSAVQRSVMSVSKTAKNKHFGSSYATLNGVLDALRVPLLDNDLHITQPIVTRDDGTMLLQTIIYHKSGQSLVSEMVIPTTERYTLVGSGITYYRRYSLISMFCLGAEDDDAQGADRIAASGELSRKITQEEATTFADDLERVPEFKEKTLTFMRNTLGVTSIAALERDVFMRWRKRLDKELQDKGIV